MKVSAQGAEKVWENKNLRNHFNSCVLWQGHLYGPDDSGLRCVAFDTGELKWTHREFGKGSLMVADGKMIIQSSDCNACHTIIAQGRGDELMQLTPQGQKFKHPDGEEVEGGCNDCHTGGL